MDSVAICGIPAVVDGGFVLLRIDERMQYQIQRDGDHVVPDGIDTLTFNAGGAEAAYRRVRARVTGFDPASDDLQSVALVALSREIAVITHADVLEVQALLDVDGEDVDAIVAEVFREVVSTVSRWNRRGEAPRLADQCQRT